MILIIFIVIFSILFVVVLVLLFASPFTKYERKELVNYSDRIIDAKSVSKYECGKLCINNANCSGYCYNESPVGICYILGKGPIVSPKFYANDNFSCYLK